MVKVTFQFSFKVTFDHSLSVVEYFNRYQSDTEHAPSDPGIGMF